MSITGTGTQADPYIVETYEDLKTAVEYPTEDDMCYARYVEFKEKVNIDLASEYPGQASPDITVGVGIRTGNWSPKVHLFIDGKGSTISGYSSELPLFHIPYANRNDACHSIDTATDTGYFELKNITITKGYFPQSPIIAVRSTPKLRNVSIDAMIENPDCLMFSIYPGKHTGFIKQCAFSFVKTKYDNSHNSGRLVPFSDKNKQLYWGNNNQGSQNHTWDSMSNDYGCYPINRIPITDCKLDISSIVPVTFLTTASISSSSGVVKSYFSRNTIILRGTTQILHFFADGGTGNADGNTSIANCVIKGNSTGQIDLNFTNPAGSEIGYTKLDGGVCVVDHTALPNAVIQVPAEKNSPFKLLTAEEIKNPAYLRSIGFECGG